MEFGERGFSFGETGGLELTTDGSQVDLITEHLQSQIKGRTVQRIVWKFLECSLQTVFSIILMTL